VKLSNMKVAILLSLFASTFPFASSSSGPVVTNAHGTGVTYNGLYANEIESFIGIRYAEDTGGENRFRPPIPYTPAAGSSIDATSAGPSCPQRIDHRAKSPFNAYSYVTEISEDCLRLNVWRPNGTQAGDKLPVLVYIYGGGFNSGQKDGILNQPG
jgi:carboxylesterase type B